MRRGEIWLADLDPIVGSEVKGRRPVVLVSNDAANIQAERMGRGVLTVVPVTSSIARVFAFQVLMSPEESGLDRESKAQAEQVRSIDARRLERRVGRLTPRLGWELDEALRIHLGL